MIREARNYPYPVASLSSWHGGMKNGTPLGSEAMKLEHADGQPGNFKI